MSCSEPSNSIPNLSPVALNETRVRRSTFIGTLPTAVEARQFLANRTADKRQRLVESLLDRPEYADYWALQWSDILLVNRDKIGDRGAFELNRWLRAQFAHNRPYDQWVRELLTASGTSAKNGRWGAASASTAGCG